MFEYKVIEKRDDSLFGEVEILNTWVFSVKWELVSIMCTILFLVGEIITSRGR